MYRLSTSVKAGYKNIGFGFVTFESEESLNAAVEKLNKHDFKGQPLNVEKAKPKRHGRFARGKGRFTRSRFGRRNNIPQQDRPRSKTTLLVDNLPFSFDDDQLKEFFSTYNPVSARVIVSKYGKPFGYGFVEFEKEEDQLKALEETNGKEASSERGPRKLHIVIPFERRQIETSESEQKEN